MLVCNIVINKSHHMLIFTVHHLPFADHIIVLSENGGILEQGNFDQLNATGGYVHSLYVTHSPDQEDSQQFSSDPSSDSFALPQRGAVQEAVLAGGLNRIHGDTAVYLYYAKSIGAVNTAIFIAALCMFTFLTTFPCKFPSLAPLRLLTLANFLGGSCLVDMVGRLQCSTP